MSKHDTDLSQIYKGLKKILEDEIVYVKDEIVQVKDKNAHLEN